MGKTAAQRQREYREGKKANDPAFLERERAPVHQYYRPAAQLGKRALAQRNRYALIRNQVSRMKKRERRKEECEEKRAEFNKWTIKPVKDSLKLHAIIGLSTSEVLTANTSCYCPECLSGNFCDTWKKLSFNAKKKQEQQQDPEQPQHNDIQQQQEEPAEQQQQQQQEADQPFECDVGDFVAAAGFPQKSGNEIP